MLAVGVSQVKVARAFGIGRSSVSRWKSREEVQEMIRAQAARLAEAVPDAVNFQRNVVKAGRRESGKILRRRKAGENLEPVDYKLLEAAGRASENVLKTTGLLPANTTSQTFNTLIIGDNEGLSPIISRLMCGTEIDVTPEDEEETEGGTSDA